MMNRTTQHLALLLLRLRKNFKYPLISGTVPIGSFSTVTTPGVKKNRPFRCSVQMSPTIAIAHKISLGHGVPGTILEMPKGCGPSKYAVAKTMVLLGVQLPPHLAKRNYGHQPVIYDLTFDFDWRRVPRDLGDIQMRVDFSNEVVSLHLRLVGQSSNTLTGLLGLLGQYCEQSSFQKAQKIPHRCGREPQALARGRIAR